MRIRLGVSPDIDLDSMGTAIDAALEATTAAQVPLLARGVVPDIRSAINAGKVKWKPEPPGDEHFDDARTVLVRGWGDCDDLAPWHAAGLRATGEDPGARAFVYQSGPRRWHAVVSRSDGSVDDPSAWAGMRRRGDVVGAGAPAWPPMWDGKLGLAAYPFQGGWAGRVDVPDGVWPISWTALSTGPTPAHAVVGAIRGAANVAMCAGVPRELDVMRLCGLDSVLCGQEMDVVGDILGEDYVGFLPAILPAAGALLGPAMGALGNIIPGMGGRPAAAPAAPVAAPAGGGGFGGGVAPGTTLTMPGGPIIVRF
jgi:hypothetical protein